MKPEHKQILLNIAQQPEPITKEIALEILEATIDDLSLILYASDAVRRHYFGQRVRLCSIVNAKSGRCSEDCTFCAQSAHYPGTAATSYPLLSKTDLQNAHAKASENPILFFSPVTSGKSVTDEEIDQICEAIREKKDSGAHWCASLGCLSMDQLKRLKEAGLRRYHHNLETAESFFPKICTTHSYQDRMETVRSSKEAGLEVCCGGLLGMGESREQRVELAMTLAELKVDSIPLNFLQPIPGTPLENQPRMASLDILLTIAMFRLVNPESEIRIAAGRQDLRRLQALLFMAGCNGMMVGDLLTVPGEDLEDDLIMLRDLGMEVEGE